MHVCLMNSAPDWGGGERMFLELAAGFRAAGHGATLVCRPGSALAARAAGVVPACELPCRGDLDLRTLRAVHALLGRTRAAALLCNRGRDCLLGGLAARLRGVPAIRVKAMEETRRTLRNRLIYGGLLAAVVSVSHAVDAGLAPLGIPAARRHVIPNGIAVVPPPVTRAAARAALGLPPDAFVAAFTGRLVPEKGVDLLAPAVAAVRRAGVPVQLVVAGDGPLRAAAEAQCAAAGVGDAVRFLGFVDEPLRVLRAADAAVLPSRTEAFPVAALEALALGVPLVATAVGGLPEIVTPEVSGLLVPAGDPAALAAALVRLHRDPQLAARLARGGRERARELSREAMIARYVALIRSLAPGRTDGRP